MGMIASMDRIADATQVPLEYREGKVSGKASALYSPIPSLTLQFNLHAEKLFFNEQVGVLFHVMGDLYLLAAHFEKTETVTAFLVDGMAIDVDGIQVFPQDVIKKEFTLKQAVDTLKPGIVKSFIWDRADKKWNTMKLS
jgi:hypothetical protein